MIDKKKDRDKLAGILADSLNKKFKDFKVAYFLDGADETPTDLTEWQIPRDWVVWEYL